MTVVEPGAPALPPPSQLIAPAHFSPDAPPRRGAAATATVAWMLASLSALTLWSAAYASVFSAVQEHRSQKVLHAQLREQFAKQTSAIGGVIATRAPLAIVRAPSVGIDGDVIVEGTSAGTLEVGPGHRRDTPLPGQPGVSVVMGRSALFGAPFRHLASIHTGEVVAVETGQGKFVFRVERVRRDGDELPPRLAAGASRLTLMTSERHGVDRRTVYVDALLDGDSQAPPTHRHVTAIRASEAAMHGDQRALVPLLVWLAALAAAVTAGAWLRPRWRVAQLVLVGVPTLLACMWGVSQTVARLLPNLL